VAVLEGLLLGETAPHRDERERITQPTLIVGHQRDPVHPFSDSGMLADELPQSRLVEASSILEWRVAPKRLTEELAGFLDEVWARSGQNLHPSHRANGNGRRPGAAVGG
jgi:pimeloyl-ACP methyl ester carboxylesterase